MTLDLSGLAAAPTLAGVADSVLSGLITLGEFALLICVVVFVHEMGHLLVAKAFKVKAEKFSLGFGPRLFGFQLGETEYRFSLLPFGGYVKFAGDNPHEEVRPEDKGRGFLEAKPLARGLIAFAGPAANFVLALLIGFALHLLPHTDTAAVVGFVKPGSPADRAGLRHGDKLLAVDGASVRGFAEVKEKVSGIWDRAVTLRLQRGAQQLELSVRPAVVEQDTPLGMRRRGTIGIAAASRTAQIAVLGPDTPAGKSGLQTFDTVTKLGTEDVKSYEQLLDLLAARLSRAGEPEVASVTVSRRAPPAPLPALPSPGQKLDPAREQSAAPEPAAQPAQGSLTLPALGRSVLPGEVESLLGLASSDLNINQVRPGSGAEAAGLRRGDRVVQVQGKPVVWWDDEVERIRLQVGPAPLALVVLRDGARVEVKVNQTMHPARDEAGVRKQYPVLGALPPQTIFRGDDSWVSYGYPAGEALRRAATDVFDSAYSTLLAMSMMVTGKLSAQALGGPIMIADMTRKMADYGLLAFFAWMAAISGNLGLMNLLPIPVLDGFHLLSALVEGVRRRPLSLRFREVANTVGLVMVLGLMLFAMGNDVMRSLFD